MKRFSLISALLIFIGLFYGIFIYMNDISNDHVLAEDDEVQQMLPSVSVLVPQPNDVVYSPLDIKGKARETWFFEASFPVEIVDAHGTVLGSGVAQAQGDWMTAEYVPFTATITFAPATTDTGLLILKKDNPSGLSEHDAMIAIPITF